MKTQLLTFLTFLLTLGCSKDNPPQEQLPPITRIGANTAGCYINGELLIPKNGTQYFGGPSSYGLTIGAGGGLMNLL